jgi:hypothetical protein
MSNTPKTGSNESSRPTSGRQGSPGGADTATPVKPPNASHSAPNPPDKMTDKRQDDSASRATYPAPYNID